MKKIFSGMKGGVTWAAKNEKSFLSSLRLSTNWDGVRSAQKVFSYLSILGSFLFVSLFFAPKFCIAEIVDVNYRALSIVESSQNPKAVSFLGAKYGRGLFQVSEIALKDFNEYNGLSVAPSELFDASVNEMVAVWLIEFRIPQILRRLGRRVTLSSVLSAYNKGYSGGLAHKYIEKYKKAVADAKV